MEPTESERQDRVYAAQLLHIRFMQEQAERERDTQLRLTRDTDWADWAEQQKNWSK